MKIHSVNNFGTNNYNCDKKAKNNVKFGSYARVKHFWLIEDISLFGSNRKLEEVIGFDLIKNCQDRFDELLNKALINLKNAETAEQKLGCGERIDKSIRTLCSKDTQLSKHKTTVTVYRNEREPYLFTGEDAERILAKANNSDTEQKGVSEIEIKNAHDRKKEDDKFYQNPFLGIITKKILPIKNKGSDRRLDILVIHRPILNKEKKEYIGGTCIDIQIAPNGSLSAPVLPQGIY